MLTVGVVGANRFQGHIVACGMTAGHLSKLFASTTRHAVFRVCTVPACKRCSHTSWKSSAVPPFLWKASHVGGWWTAPCQDDPIIVHSCLCLCSPYVERCAHDCMSVCQESARGEDSHRGSEHSRPSVWPDREDK